jgi:thiopurine S-methyltransferase
VEKTANLLTGNGKLAGLLFNREFDTNPPFGGTEEMYRQLFLNRFRIKYLEACDNSIPARQGTELFMLMQKNKA